MNYRDVAAVDPYSKLIYKKFNLEYDMLPNEKVEIIVPCQIAVKITVNNYIYNKRRQQTINTGSIFFNKIDMVFTVIIGGMKPPMGLRNAGQGVSSQ